MYNAGEIYKVVREDAAIHLAARLGVEFAQLLACLSHAHVVQNQQCVDAFLSCHTSGHVFLQASNQVQK